MDRATAKVLRDPVDLVHGYKGLVSQLISSVPGGGRCFVGSLLLHLPLPFLLRIRQFPPLRPPPIDPLDLPIENDSTEDFWMDTK